VRRGASRHEQAECALIENSGLFDRTWYTAQYFTELQSGADPILDYIRVGARAGRDPNPLFDTDWYLSRYPEVQESGINPLAHYVQHGAAQGCDPSPLFDSGQNLSNCSALENVNALANYLQNGWRKGVLPCVPAHLLCDMKVAIVVHLFYAELWREIAGWLRNVPIDFDLYVSVPRENAAALCNLVLHSHPQAKVQTVPNVGRDVGAFLAVLPKVLAGQYSVICKLHSKKGPAYPQAWRDLLLRGLLGNKLLVTRILHAFSNDPELAIVGTRDVYLSGATNTTQNATMVESIARTLYPVQSIPGHWGFFAGTMFWARPDFLRPLANCDGHILSFEEDNSRNDGQLAHALERVFGMMATVGGKHIGLTDIRGSGPLDGAVHVIPAPGRPYEGSFIQVLRSHAVALRRASPLRYPSSPTLLGQSNTSSCTQRKYEPSGTGAETDHWASDAGRRFEILIRSALTDLELTAVLQMARRARDFCVRRLQARLIASSPLFDRTWYLQTYPDVQKAGVNPALHYVARGAAEYRDPGPHFDTAWYLAYYPDVAERRANPLVHYLKYGMDEGRHARSSEIAIGEVEDAMLCCRKQPRSASEISLFVTHSSDGQIKPHVRHYLEALHRHGISPVLIVAADTKFCELDSHLTALLDGLYVRQNVGYDFAAWAHILRRNPQLLSTDILYLINDSTIGPLNEQKFEHLLKRIRSSSSDVVGLTDSYERGWHIQSYFIALKGRVLSSLILQAFIGQIKNLKAKNDVVVAYEVRLAQTLRSAGLNCEVLFPRTFAAGKAYNPSLLDWRSLVGCGLPFVKLAALRDTFGDSDWRTVLKSDGFDYRLAEYALASRR
jgi:lipopolysaccharide biosynthesis protein